MSIHVIALDRVCMSLMLCNHFSGSSFIRERDWFMRIGHWNCVVARSRAVV